MATTVRVQHETLDELHRLHEQKYPDNHKYIPLGQTIDVVIRDELNNISNGGDER